MKDRKILVLTSCSDRKKSARMKAIDLYEGGFFIQVKKFVKLHKFDLRIISAKYGLIAPNDLISPYNKRIKKNQDILELREIVAPKLKKLLNNGYDKVLILMGENYKKIIESISENNKDIFLFFFDKRGLGGYLSLMKKLLNIEKNLLYKLLFNQKNNTITINLIEKQINRFKKLDSISG